MKFDLQPPLSLFENESRKSADGRISTGWNKCTLPVSPSLHL